MGPNYNVFSSVIIYFILLIRPSFSSTSISPHRVVVTGASGYIGRSVVRELVNRNIPTLAVVRSEKLSPITSSFLQGSEVVISDVLVSEDIDRVMKEFGPTASICCLASRTGVPKDSWAVDYGGGLNTLNAFCKNAVGDSPHFVLLSAFCVGKPRLQFQLAKLKLEEAIRSETSVSHSIVRPTAYFKSVDGQLESVSKGNPVLFFGDGTCSANAISETDLANYLCNCIFDPSLLMNGTRDIGGPDVPPITKRQTAELIFDTLKVPQDKRRVVSLPLGIFDFIISAFSSFEKVFKALGLQELSGNCADGAEIARIVHYYASEPMVAVGEGSVQGTVHLKDHFEKLAQRGGLEEIDPMTTTAGVLSAIATNNKSVRVRS